MQQPLADSHRPLDIGFVLTPGMLTTGTALPYEMWLAAIDYQRAKRRHERGCHLHLVEVPALRERGPLALAPTCTIADSPQLDVVYIPALWRSPRSVAKDIGAVLSRWLLAQRAHGAQIAAVSTGVTLLAASGLLDGRAATTHWFNFAQFERMFPAVDLKRQFFITQSGPLYCAASINSLADVTVHLIERFFDRDCAQHVERNFSHEIRRTYAEYRYLDGGTTPLHDEIAVEAQMWIASNLAAETTVAALAARFGIAVRTLERRFRAATGISVRQYWQQQRIVLAKELLEMTNLSVGDIAWRVGYRDAGFFARLFQREMSVGPLAYRHTVRAKLFHSDHPAGASGVNRFDNQENMAKNL